MMWLYKVYTNSEKMYKQLFLFSKDYREKTKELDAIKITWVKIG